MEAKKAFLKQSLLSTVLLAVMMAIFYVSARRTNIPRSYLFIVVNFIHLIGSNLAIYRYNPELLIQRLKIRRKGSKTWDEVLMRITNLTALLVLPVVAGLDVGFYHWSSLGIEYAVLGIIIAAVSSVMLNWAMIVNPYFEPTVRIQEEREHHVISTGPYAIVRHPGYLSGILWLTATPLILGSLYALGAVVLFVILITFRTYLEDSTLQKELPGYAEYVQKVRYRLFPLIW
jgi:protein-S-isoprenylcysteine O-methyltransferase Ste14